MTLCEEVVIGNSLNLNADRHVWSCSTLAGFPNQNMTNKIEGFEFLDLPRESKWRRNHTKEDNGRNGKSVEIQLVKKGELEAYDLHVIFKLSSLRTVPYLTHAPDH